MRIAFGRLVKFATALLLGIALAGPMHRASAQTVDDIIKKGKVVIGVNTTTPIFGLMGKDGQPEGYDPDVARLVGKYMGVPVEFVSVTGANRIPYLLSGQVDMVIALFGIAAIVAKLPSSTCCWQLTGSSPISLTHLRSSRSVAAPGSLKARCPLTPMPRRTASIGVSFRSSS